jgi:hypothetical protein
MTDPRAVKEFNTLVRNKMSKYAAVHDGSEESRTSLEVQLMGMSDTATMRMSETSRTAQKAFITKQVGGHIDRITNEVYNDPASIETAFQQLNGLMGEFGPALDDVDEIELMSNAQSMVVEGALNSFIDAGDYEGAKKLIDDNGRFITSMPAKQQMSILGRVNQGLAAQEREKTQLINKMRSIEAASKEAGVDISKTKLFEAATGIKEGDTPQSKVDSFAQITNTPPEKITPAIVAKIGFGVDLPAAEEVDMNKERLPESRGGGFTPKGIGVMIKTPYEAAASTKLAVEKVILQADDFINTGNNQAGLAAMIAFNKLIDDGAVVREGDLKISAEGNSSFEKIQLLMDKIGKGGIATPNQIQEMKASAQIFQNAVLEASKMQMDPYLAEAQERGYRMIDIGIPQSSYDAIFKNVKTAEDANQTNRKIEEKAKAYGMSVREALAATAKKRNMTVEEVAKKLNYTGKLQ